MLNGHVAAAGRARPPRPPRPREGEPAGRAVAPASSASLGTTAPVCLPPGGNRRGLGAILLGGCQQQAAAPPPPPPAHSVQWSVPAPPRRIVRPKPKPPVPAGKEASDTEPTLETEPVAAAPAAPVESSLAPPSPAELIGLDQQQIVALLGPASETARRPPGALWRYKAGDCELDVSFYMELSSGRMRALHYELKPGSSAGIPETSCMRAIIGGNRKEEPS
jgi:hypothetical protein